VKIIPAFLESHNSHHDVLLTKSEIFIVKHIKSGANVIWNSAVKNRYMVHMIDSLPCWRWPKLQNRKAWRKC